MPDQDDSPKSARDTMDSVQRRKLLKTLGGTSVAGVGIGFMGKPAVVNATSDGHMAYGFGDPNDSLTDNDIQDIINKATEAYHEGGTGRNKIVVSKPVDPAVVSKPVDPALPNPIRPNQHVVGYAIKIYPDGTTQTYAGMVNEVDDEIRQRNLKMAQEETKEFVEAFEGQSSAKPIDRSDFSGGQDG